MSVSRSFHEVSSNMASTSSEPSGLRCCARYNLDSIVPPISHRYEFEVLPSFYHKRGEIRSVNSHIFCPRCRTEGMDIQPSVPTLPPPTIVPPVNSAATSAASAVASTASGADSGGSTLKSQSCSRTATAEAAGFAWLPPVSKQNKRLKKSIF